MKLTSGAHHKYNTKHRRRLTAEEIEQIEELRAAGWKYRQLAAHFRIGKSYLYNIMRTQTNTLFSEKPLQLPNTNPGWDFKNDNIKTNLDHAFSARP